MQTTIDRIRELKTEAKNQRDRGLSGYKRAVQRLAEAVRLADEGLAQTTVPSARTQFAAELSDCHGLIGGVKRRWALEGPSEERAQLFAESCLAYDEGYRTESDPQYALASTYNRLNRLIGRLLLAPESLAAKGVADLGRGLAPLDLGAELALTARLIEQQLSGAGAGDYWAMANLALTRLLLGQSDATHAFEGFVTVSPPGFAYVSVLDSLRPLAALPIAPAPALQDAVRLLEARASRLRA